jgi:hypothetical protein
MNLTIKLSLLMMGLLAAGEETLVEQIAESGRCVTLGDTADSRVAIWPRIAPGPPPLLSFRYYQGKTHQRFSNSELMLDDAGH